MKIIKMQLNKINAKNNIIMPLKKHSDNLGYTKYLPSFTKEWKNIIYSYNKNILRNIPINYFNINNIINNYFNLYFKNWQFIKDKYNIFRKKRAKYLNKIYVSNADIKYTSDKAMITLYLINGEKYRTLDKYKYLNKKIRKEFYKHFVKIYKNLPKKLHYIMINNLSKKYLFVKSIFNKATIVKYKFNYLDKFNRLNYYFIKKIWVIIERKSLNKNTINKMFLSTVKIKKKKLEKNSFQWYLLLLRRYQLMYTLNQYKFSKSKLLPILTKYLQILLGKNIEYNFIKLKSVSHNTDIMTKFVVLKVLKRKNTNFINSMSSALNSPIIPEETNKILARTPIAKYENIDPFFQKFKDSKLTSNISNNESNTADTLIHNAYNSKDTTYNTVYNNINYKNIGGIMLELSGRLTKRYRADRARHFLRKKGGFRNNASSYKQWSNILMRGNTIANQSYSLNKSKRRIGSFAVKGWIVGK